MHATSYDVFAVLFITMGLSPSKLKAKPCKRDYITVQNSDDCIPCQMCPPGQELHPKCGSQIKENERGDIECKPCSAGFYSNEFGIRPCQECHHCLQSQTVFKPCTNISDTNCSECGKGFYEEKTSLNCQQCSCCCGDAEDKKIEKCERDNQPEGHHCTSHRRQECCKTPTAPVGKQGGKQSTLPTWQIICIVVGGVACIAGVIITIKCYFMKKQRRREQHQTGSHDSEVRGSSQSGVTTADITDSGPRSSIPLTVILPNSANSQHTSNQHHIEEPNGNTHGHNVANGQQNRLSNMNHEDPTDLDGYQNINYVSQTNLPQDPTSSTGSEQGDFSGQPSSSGVVDENSTRGQLNRLNEAYNDSKPGSPDLDGRKKTDLRSQALKSNKELTKKVERQLSTDSQKSNSSDTQKTGSKQGRSGSISSFKEFARTKLPKRQSSADMESLFPEESDQEDVQLPKNKTFKLCKLDMEMRDLIGKMLDNPPADSVGNTKKLAIAYKLRDLDIKAAMKFKTPSEQVLGYIDAMYPNETVYRFCEVLHGRLQRNDIVDVLSNHLDEIDKKGTSLDGTNK